MFLDDGADLGVDEQLEPGEGALDDGGDPLTDMEQDPTPQNQAGYGVRNQAIRQSYG